MLSPFDEELTPEQRLERAIELSLLVTKIVTHVICHVIVDFREQLEEDERLSVALAFLQRVTTTHMCNHKLTAEGLVYEFQGQQFQLHEGYKTMALTRSVYEHLAMFYFLYEHPKSEEERDVVWRYWQANGKRNGSIEAVMNGDKYEVKRISYSQAWKFLFKNEETAELYQHLSMHCHPVFDGLDQYQNQSACDQGDDSIPLYLSSSFLAHLCRLFLKLIPQHEKMIKGEFTDHDLSVFRELAQII